MLDKSLALFAFAVLLGFLGILSFTILEIDLMAVAALTIGLAGWDLFKS